MRFTSRRIGIWKCWFLWREENRRTRRKTLRARTRTNNKLNPRMTQRPRIEPGPHWWQASALTTAPFLHHSCSPCSLSYINIKKEQRKLKIVPRIKLSYNLYKQLLRPDVVFVIFLFSTSQPKSCRLPILL